jgi:hypothetical protein|tara:strand:- start:164 stop:361 length:198 start_codon:yes stop_codon:yes gene_type:complete
MSEKENSINIGGENIVDDIVLGNLAASKRSIADLLSQKIKTEVGEYKQNFASTIFAETETEDKET